MKCNLDYLISNDLMEPEVNICILIPGFIKSYQHLSYLETLFKSIKARNIYVFGNIFSYIISPNINKDKIQYVNTKNKIDISKLSIFNSFSFVSDNYEKYDKDGYDNRIYSQWFNVRKSFDLYLEFSKKYNIKCDIFIRMRSDLHIESVDRLNKTIKKSIQLNKIIFFIGSCDIVEDQLFIGPYKLFNKIMLLSDNISDYYLLEDINKKIIEHKNSKNKTEFNRYLRFGNESEILLWTHINKYIRNKELLLIPKQKLFYLKRD